MRLSRKEIRDEELIRKVISRALVCRLGLCRENKPHIVPVDFGYDGKEIYFHTARDGMKIDYITANPSVCFEMEESANIIPNNEAACKWSVSFYCVIGIGRVEEILDSQHRNYAMEQIMKHYSSRNWIIDQDKFNKMRIWRIQIEQITEKQSLDKISNNIVSISFQGLPDTISLAKKRGFEYIQS